MTDNDALLVDAQEGLVEAFGLPNLERVTVAPAGELDEGTDVGVVGMSSTPSPVPVASRGIVTDDDFMDDDFEAAGAQTAAGGHGVRKLRGSRRHQTRAFDFSDSPLPRLPLGDEAGQLGRQPHGRSREATDFPEAETFSRFGGDGSERTRGGRQLQEEEGEAEGEPVELDFEVALPVEGFEGATSPATQMAAMVNDYSEQGIYALADSLGVDPANVR